MTSIPAPVLFAIVVLIGWPLAQLVSVWLVSGARSEVRALADELRRDPRFGEADRELLDRRLADAKGEPAFALFPVVIPFGIVAMSAEAFLGRSPPKTAEDGAGFLAHLERFEMQAGRSAPGLTIWKDERFRRLAVLTNDIGITRWPISLALTVVTALMTLPVYLLAYGLRSSWTAFVTSVVRRWAVSIRFAHQGL